VARSALVLGNLADGLADQPLRRLLHPLQLFFHVFPAVLPVTTVNFNGMNVVFLGILAISGVSWLAFGRKSFTGPIKERLDGNI
jgi:hypothetical protein